MNTQMSLEEYKKAALTYLRKESQDSTPTDLEKSLMTMPDEDWEVYMRDFSPEVMIQGRVSGLI